MTQEEVVYYTDKLETISTQLQEVAGRYRMLNSGAYKSLKSEVDGLLAQTKRKSQQDAQSPQKDQ